MRNMVKLIVVLVVAGVFISSAAYAGYDTTASSGGQNKAALVDAGNKIGNLGPSHKGTPFVWIAMENKDSDRFLNKSYIKLEMKKEAKS